MDGTWSEDLFKVAGIHAIALLTPGPDSLLTLRNSVTHSRAHGLATVAGILVSELCVASVVLGGLSWILSSSPQALRLLSVLGVLYLLVLGVQAVFPGKKTTRPDALEASSPRTTTQSCFTQGFLANTLNPAGLFDLLGVNTAVLHPDTHSWTRQACFQLEMSAMSLVYFGTLAALASHPAVLTRLAPVQRPFTRFLGVCLLASGCLAAWHLWSRHPHVAP